MSQAASKKQKADILDDITAKEPNVSDYSELAKRGVADSRAKYGDGNYGGEGYGKYQGDLMDDDLITVYRVQPVTNSQIITGGAFRRLRESGSNLLDANSKRAELLTEISHSNPNRRIRAMENAQASGRKSPFISTTKNQDTALRELEKAKKQGESVELVTIQGPRSGGLDFEDTFGSLGGRKSPGRMKDAELEEFGIPDLFIPANKPSRSGYIVTGRRK